jgi:hypothetical protein
MQIITLTSDFGYRDHSVATLKGKLLNTDRNLNLVDITHDITPYDIEEAAYIFRAAYPSFPKATIHMISVFEFYNGHNRLIFFNRNGHWFIGPDNGLFSLVFPESPTGVFSLQLNLEEPFPIQNAFARILEALLKGIPPEEFAEEIHSITRKLNLKAVVTKGDIRGSVIYFDHYGNAIVNIHKDLFDKVCAGRNFAVYFKRFDPISKLSEHYLDAEIGEPICTFNSQGLLEISVTLGRAEKLLGLKKGDAIQIEFNDDV